MTQELQLLVDASVAPEARLPDTPPLTLTRNFAWVFGVCLSTLLTAPVVIAWIASMILS